MAFYQEGQAFAQRDPEAAHRQCDEVRGNARANASSLAPESRDFTQGIDQDECWEALPRYQGTVAQQIERLTHDHVVQEADGNVRAVSEAERAVRLRKAHAAHAELSQTGSLRNEPGRSPTNAYNVILISP